jgi:uncharacterized protein involved in outer membrane biogenesis
MKKVIKILLIACAVVAVLALAKNTLAKIAVSTTVRAVTGLKLGIQRINVGILSTDVGAKGIRLMNPRGFPDRVMMKVADLYVDYDTRAFLRGTVHLEKVKVDLEEFTVIRNADGKLNVNSIKAMQTVKKERATQAPRQKRAKPTSFQIDLLELRVGKVIYKDYSGGDPPKVREFNVQIEEKYRNITNPSLLAALIVTRALLHTTLSGLPGLDLPIAEIRKQLTDAVFGTAGQALQETTKKLQEILP